NRFVGFSDHDHRRTTRRDLHGVCHCSLATRGSPLPPATIRSCQSTTRPRVDRALLLPVSQEPAPRRTFSSQEFSGSPLARVPSGTCARMWSRRQAVDTGQSASASIILQCCIGPCVIPDQITIESSVRKVA